jgi:hypothetical protein
VGGGIVILFYFMAVGVAYAGAGLLDLVLLPFRPLMPATYYVDSFVVDATKVRGHAAALHVGHYTIRPPAGGDWYRISEAQPAVRYLFTVPESGADGAWELFIRNPSARRSSVVRKLAGTRFGGQSADYVPQPPRGRTEPAAFVRIDRLPPGDGALQDRLASFIDHVRAGPPAYGLLSTNAGRYQVAGHESSFADIDGMPCLRDEFVYLWMDNPGGKGGLARRVEHTLACADPSCPGQVVSLVVRGKADAHGDLERQGRAFLDGLRVDKTVAPVCAAS